MRAVHIAAEAYPWVKVGGLADAVSGLCRAIAEKGHTITLILPKYRALRMPANARPEVYGTLHDSLGPLPLRGAVWHTRSSAPFSVWLIDVPELFDRRGVYVDPEWGEYTDNLLRFVGWCRLALRALIHADAVPDIVHVHDWHAAMVVVYMRHALDFRAHFAHCGTVLTIHNLAYQGVFAPVMWPFLNLPGTLSRNPALEFHGRINILKAGIITADRVTTVSPAYAEEILTPAGGHGLDEVLRGLRHRVVGILNGIDTTVWDPARDPWIPARYTPDHLEGKRVCKRALMRRLGLDLEDGAPLCGMIARLTEQKGVDLVIQVTPWLIQRGAGVVVQGIGDPRYETALQQLADTYPGRMVYLRQYDEEMAHWIEAGCDIYLMPSRFEPCGLNQMYSMRYGTIPVVHAVGGLRDTVIDVRVDPERGTGWTFQEPTAEAFTAALADALNFYRQPGLWHTIIRRCMRQEFSWARAAQQYLHVYQQIIRR